MNGSLAKVYQQFFAVFEEQNVQVMFHVAALTASAILLTPSFVQAEAGDLDPTFGSGGVVATNFGASAEIMSDRTVMVQDDGKILVVGLPMAHLQGWVARFDWNGAPDTSFGSNGLAIGPFSFLSLALQSDNKAVVAGYSYQLGLDSEFAVARYDSEGKLDTSFGAAGWVTTDAGLGGDVGTNVLVQPDGRILLAGTSYALDGQADIALVRYLADGTLDTSFGDNGGVITDLEGPGDNPTSIDLQDDGKIVVAGFQTAGTIIEDMFVARYFADGRLDEGFGNGGYVITNLGTSTSTTTTSMRVQRDGKIVVAASAFGGTSQDIVLVRFTENGTLDGSFGSGGVVFTDIGYSDRPLTVEIQPNQKILVAGYSGVTGRPYRDLDVALVRYNEDGSLDVGFGSEGKVLQENGEAYGLALQPDDGNIVVAAEVGWSLNLLRYEGDNPWWQNGSYGWLLTQGGNWFESFDLGNLWFSDASWAWSDYLEGWLWGDGTTGRLWSVQYKWLDAAGDGDGWFLSSALGWIYVGDYGGAVWSSEFGWVWPFGDGNWFFSDVYGWLAADGAGNVWSHDRGQWL